MNIFNLVLFSLVVGILIFVSTQNILFIFSQNISAQEFTSKTNNFISTIERISKLDVENFYHEHFLGLANVSIKNNILKVVSGKHELSYYLPFNVEDTEIINKGRICIIKNKEKITIQACDEILYLIDGVCTLTECRTSSPDCKGPNKICINDGYCNTFIGENCKNSDDCLDSGVCCPEDPSSDEKGITNRYNLKEGEECYCDNQCSSNLRCNTVDPSFKDYKSGKACCPEGKSWNGNDCVESKPQLTLLFIPVNWKGNWNFEEVAKKHFDFIVKSYPIKDCPNKVKGIFEENARCDFTPTCTCYDILMIFNCGRKTGYNFDFVIGLTDQYLCGDFTCTIIPAAYVVGDDPLASAHELGHYFGLNDEYIDACRCGFGLINPRSNCLKSDIGGSDAIPPYTSEYCSEKGTKCPSSYVRTCYGNKNQLGGRDIMGSVISPGPRAFARESWNWLTKINKLKC